MPISSEKSGKKGPLTYGPRWFHKWWKMVLTHIHKSHGPMGGEKWSQQLSKCRYLSTDLSTWSINHGQQGFIYWRIRLIFTVDADSPTENYGQSLMVDKFLHLRYGGNRTRAEQTSKSHQVFDLNHSAGRVYTIGTEGSHHMWWEPSVPIVYAR